MSVKILLFLNKFFKLPLHPFNMQNDGIKKYSMWQYEKGIETIKNYLEFCSIDEMFKNKDILDVGCGAAGKSLYYLSQGANSVIGLDVVESYKKEAYDLQRKLGLDGFTFVVGDAAKTLFEDNSFDNIIMNDAMEHVDKPEAVLRELYRVLKPGGRLYINFPPYNHPFGAHLSDAIGIPWVHLLFSDKTLIKAYKQLVKNLPDGENRIKFRISVNESGEEYFSYINKMTIKRFHKLLETTLFKIKYYNEVPLRKIFSAFVNKKFFKDCFVKMVVCVLEK